MTRAVLGTRRPCDASEPLCRAVQVISLQRQVSKEAERAQACEGDKATLAEANKKLLSHFSSVFQSAQDVEAGLAFKGLNVTRA